MIQIIYYSTALNQELNLTVISSLSIKIKNDCLVLVNYNTMMKELQTLSIHIRYHKHASLLQDSSYIGIGVQ